MTTVFENLRQRFALPESPIPPGSAEAEDDEDDTTGDELDVEDTSDDEFEEASEPDMKAVVLTILPILIPILSRMLGRHGMRSTFHG